MKRGPKNKYLRKLWFFYKNLKFDIFGFTNREVIAIQNQIIIDREKAICELSEENARLQNEVIDLREKLTDYEHEQY